MSKPTDLIVALDYPEAADADKVIHSLGDLPVIYKVGSELFLAAGPEFVRKLTAQGRRVFLDLKFHDIPNTVAKAAGRAAQLGVEMFTLHISGGQAMIEAVRAELSSLPKRPKILGVTVLTSFSEAGWSTVCDAATGGAKTISNSVVSLAQAGERWGLDGLVCSAHELEPVRRSAARLWTVVPGIRPRGSAAQDQARVMTAAEARKAGADAVVVGRPITQAADARATTAAILDELRS